MARAEARARHGAGMPVPRATLPSALAARAFTVQDGATAGLSPDQLRRVTLRSPTRGLRAGGRAPEADDVHSRCSELLPVLPGDAVFCHVTALALLGVDLPAPSHRRGPLHVQVGPSSTRPRRVGIVGHTRSADAVGRWILRGGIPVLLPELAWLQLAAHWPVEDLVLVGDALTRRQGPVSSTALLRAAVEALGPRARGRRRLADSLALVRPRTDSPMETRLRLVLVGAGLPTPSVNVPARAPDGRFLALPDLSYPAQRVAVEYDGDVHRTDRRTWRRDIARRQALESHGWRVITCTADDVLRHPDRPVAWVRAALERSPRMQ